MKLEINELLICINKIKYDIFCLIINSLIFYNIGD